MLGAPLFIGETFLRGVTVASQLGFRFPSFRIFPFVKCLLTMIGVPSELMQALEARIENRIFAFGPARSNGIWNQLMPSEMRAGAWNRFVAVAAVRGPRGCDTESSTRILHARIHPNMQDEANLFRRLFWPVFVGWSLRIVVVTLVYQGFLDPGRDHWEFGYEIGRVARSIVLGHGFANPYWSNTGPTALLCPVYPYLMACVFAVFGVYTKASALVFLGLNSFFSAITAVPIFFIAHRTFDLRTAKLAAWVWAFFPYAIYFSAATMWYHSFTGLLLTLILLAALSLTSSDQLMAWAGFGGLFGFAALTNPVILGVAPFLGAWLWIELTRQRKRAVAATAVGLLATVVTILPWSVRNELILHHPIVFKDGFWMEVCVGNVNGSLHWWDGTEHPSGTTVDRERFERQGEIAYMAEKRRRAIEYINNHAGRYAIRSLRHVIFMWTGFWSFNRQYLEQEPFDPENIFFLTSLSILSFAGLYQGLREAHTKFTAIAYVLVLLSFPIPYYLSHLDPGFRHPVDPLLTILASSAIGRWFGRSGVVPAAKEEQEERDLVPR